MSKRDPVHDAFSDLILKLGRQGVDPRHIRVALAANIVGLCEAAHHDPNLALSDVQHAVEVHHTLVTEVEKHQQRKEGKPLPTLAKAMGDYLRSKRKE